MSITYNKNSERDRVRKKERVDAVERQRNRRTSI